MKKNLYYRDVFQRRNRLKEAFLMFFLGIASYPRLILEVFIRKDMGRRYYNLASGITVWVILFIIPLISGDSWRYGFFEQLGLHKLWYLFWAVFGVFAYIRYKEVKTIVHQFDFKHFSLSTGKSLPFFHSLKFNGKPFTPRQLEIFIEPLPFFVLGVLLFFVGQIHLALLFAISAFVYSQSYAAAYMMSDNFILDKIDEIICNEGLNNTFVHDEPAENGFEYDGIKPQSKEWRKKIYDQMFEDEHVSDAK